MSFIGKLTFFFLFSSTIRYTKPTSPINPYLRLIKGGSVCRSGPLVYGSISAYPKGGIMVRENQSLHNRQKMIRGFEAIK